MKSIINTTIYLTTIIGISACALPEGKTNHHVKQQFAKHVILIGSDGFGAYAFEKAKIPNIRKMMSQGSYSLKARAVLPTSSAVNWASMLMGSGPELHGYTEWGSKAPELPSAVVGTKGIYPTLFSLIDEQRPEAKKGSIYHWGGIAHLFEQDLVDLDYNGDTEENTVNKVLEFLINEKPIFTFIHLDEPDHAGHEYGHDTPEYYMAVEKIDSLIGKIGNKLEEENMIEESIILFTSDHGGIDKGHGGKTLLEVQIPWIIFGKGIQPKGQLNQTIVTYDTGATIAFLLGLDTPESWRGKAIKTVVDRN